MEGRRSASERQGHYMSHWKGQEVPKCVRSATHEKGEGVPKCVRSVNKKCHFEALTRKIAPKKAGRTECH